MALPFATAMFELEAYLGYPMSFMKPEDRPVFGGQPMPFPKHRSLTAVTLATQLERAGLTWRAIDPGIADLDFWRRALASAKAQDPCTVTISTTFITAAPWLYALCAVARRALPRAKLIVGGYYYATNAKQFLDLDADVLCVGEGEVRLPQIVRRLVSGARIDDIPGLYVRHESGQLRHTGHVEPLAFDQIALPDWTLSSRIDPPVDLATDQIEFAVETQRGCIFKCEFCTYRTLASPVALDAEAGANAIMAAGGDNPGFVNLVDFDGDVSARPMGEDPSAPDSEGRLSAPDLGLRTRERHQPGARQVDGAGRRPSVVRGTGKRGPSYSQPHEEGDEGVASQTGDTGSARERN